MIRSEVVAATTDELLTRIPIATDQQIVVVLENDLLGRAILALLWDQRSNLTVYLVGDDQERNMQSLRSGIAGVRNAPQVQVFTTLEAAELTAGDAALVWAVQAQRTEPDLAKRLQDRGAQITFVPFFEPFETLGNQLPVQTAASHELVLRDIIRDHAPFLNFYGDRFNPKNLYERSRYPHWIIPPEDLVVGIPQLTRRTYDAQSKVLETAEFDGSLDLAAALILQDHRATVELGPVFEVLGTTPHDVTLEFSNVYVNPAAHGALALQVHRNGRLVTSIDVATTEKDVAVAIPGVRSGTRLSATVLALKDNPKKSWEQATTTQVRIRLHPKGTHPAQGFTSRAKAWVQRRLQRRQQTK